MTNTFQSCQGQGVKGQAEKLTARRSLERGNKAAEDGVPEQNRDTGSGQGESEHTLEPGV